MSKRKKTSKTSARSKTARKAGKGKKSAPAPAPPEESAEAEAAEEPAAEEPAAEPTAGAEDGAQPAFVVGIDLGTTNCSISYVDMRVAEGQEGHGAIQILDIPQLVRAGTVGPQPLLPSFLYLPGEHEVSQDAIKLPFAGAAEDVVVGTFARDQGAAVPDRLVHSSKSWLCHPGVDRRGAILPWQSDEDIPKLSPLDCATRLLTYLRAAWNHSMAGDDPALALEQQDVLLTVPASFDPTAREMTVEAARSAGLGGVTLLEEPQAAFYAWLDAAGEEWREQLDVDDVVLVLDVGGGTTDLTLISVGDEEGSLVLERVAVGEHLLLGGDNMDLTLAHLAARRLKEQGVKLDAWQSRGLWQACRAAKEELLSDADKESAPVTVLGRGTKLVGGAVKTELKQEDIELIVHQGFFPACPGDAKPARARTAGLSEVGLPFAPDAAITKHVAAFLAAQPDRYQVPTAILFNGGVFKGEALRDAAIDVINGWLEEEGHAEIEELEGEDLDHAVSRGAAYYGMVRRGRGVRIKGGTARAFYIGIESTLPAVPGLPAPLRALCVAPQGMEEGTTARISARTFALLLGEPAQFRFLGAIGRREEAVGEIVDDWEPDEEMEELAPLEVTLEPGEDEEAGAMLPVQLESSVTEIGTLEVHCVAQDGRRFKLEWNVREQEEA